MNRPDAPRGAAVAERGRHDAEPAFVLHAYPFRETSLIVESFARNFGRVPLVAKGARRPKSAVRGMLLAFQPLLLSWSGKRELRTLVRAEWQGGQAPLTGLALVCGFYLNELLLRLLPRDDPHEQLFDFYRETLARLADRGPPAPVLRRFELGLLQELGYAVPLARDADTGLPLEATECYCYLPERGPVAVGTVPPGSAIELRGKTLLDMARDDYGDAVTLAQSKTLMRKLINHYLGGQTLHTRQLLKDLKEL